MFASDQRPYFLPDSSIRRTSARTAAVKRGFILPFAPHRKSKEGMVDESAR